MLSTHRSDAKHVEEELEAMLEDMMIDEEDAARIAARKRRFLPGAADHSSRCKSMFQQSHNILATTQDALKPDRCVPPNTILHSARNSLSEMRVEFPDVSGDLY